LLAICALTTKWISYLLMTVCLCVRVSGNVVVVLDSCMHSSCTCLRSCVACASGFVFVALFIASSCPLQALFSNTFAHGQVLRSFAQACQFGLSNALVGLNTIAFQFPATARDQHSLDPSPFENSGSNGLSRANLFSGNLCLEPSALQNSAFFRTHRFSESSSLRKPSFVRT
jgi:hypothetical protein